MRTWAHPHHRAGSTSRETWTLVCTERASTWSGPISASHLRKVGGCRIIVIKITFSDKIRRLRRHLAGVSGHTITRCCACALATYHL